MSHNEERVKNEMRKKEELGMFLIKFLLKSYLLLSLFIC